MHATSSLDDGRALREARALARLSIAVARASTAEGVARILLGELASAVPGAVAMLAVLDDAGREFEVLVGADDRGAAGGGRWSRELPSAARDVVETGRALSLSRLELRARYGDGDGDREGPTGEALPARQVALPIVPGVQPIGAVCLCWDAEPGLDPADEAHLQALVDAGAQALGRARLEDAERRTRSLLRAIVDEIPLGILILEPSAGRPLYMNRRFGELFSVPDGGKADPAASMLRPDGRPWPDAERPLLRATFHGETVTDELVVIRPPTGPRRTVLVNAWPVRDADGTMLAGVATHIDVTSRLDADTARDAFLGVLSHELRTPVTSIYAGAELLHRRVADDPAARELAEGLADEANRLHRLVENLLVLSRVERGADLRRDDPVLLHHLARRVIAYEAERWPGARFELETPGTLPAITGDESYAEQVLRNLLSNAAKYGPLGGRVRLRLEHAGDEVLVRVLDEGPGFEPGTEDRLFDLFYRAPSASRVAPGAGIGLYAVRALASAMDGRVWATNRAEGGAEVGIALPVYEPGAS
jgi:signal transduction histidine kinase